MLDIYKTSVMLSGIEKNLNITATLQSSRYHLDPIVNILNRAVIDVEIFLNFEWTFYCRWQNRMLLVGEVLERELSVVC